MPILTAVAVIKRVAIKPLALVANSRSLGQAPIPGKTDHFSDGYQENIFEQNFGDTPYSESAANPNPHLKGYGKGYGYQPKTERTFSAPELEL